MKITKNEIKIQYFLSPKHNPMINRAEFPRTIFPLLNTTNPSAITLPTTMKPNLLNRGFDLIQVISCDSKNLLAIIHRHHLYSLLASFNSSLKQRMIKVNHRHQYSVKIPIFLTHIHRQVSFWHYHRTFMAGLFV